MLQTSHMTTFTHPELLTHEGYTYVEYKGQFYKGCARCGGTGHYSFNGYDSICYKCGNQIDAKLGDHFETEAAAQKWCHEKAVRAAQRDRKREQDRLAALAKRQQAWDALAAEHPAVWALLSTVADIASFTEGREEQDVREGNAFIRKMAQRLWNLDELAYTPNQIAAIQKVVDQRTERAEVASLTPAPEGRVAVTGEITSAKTRETDYGTSYKVLVQDDRGFKVWVSLPKAQSDEAYYSFEEALAAHGDSRYDFGPDCWFLGTQDGKYTGVKGRRITFTATLEPSKDDVAFAFGSRPTKGAWL